VWVWSGASHTRIAEVPNHEAAEIAFEVAERSEPFFDWLAERKEEWTTEVVHLIATLPSCRGQNIAPADERHNATCLCCGNQPADGVCLCTAGKPHVPLAI
jgi:hypothetical protein